MIWGLAGAGAVVVGLFVLASCLTRNADLPAPQTAAYNAARDAEPAGPGITASRGAREGNDAQSDCGAPSTPAAVVNARTLESLPWSPFGRDETGWAVYEPLVAHEIHTGCGGATAGFANALATWQRAHRLGGDGQMTADTFAAMKVVWQGQRPVTRPTVLCPAPAAEATLAVGAAQDGYAGTVVRLRPGALAAYRRMAAAARADAPAIARDPRMLTIFSSYRSPEYDAARCATQRNCNGVTRAVCSPHRTGLAMDLYMGHAPGYPPDSSADPNRLFMTQGAAYQWMLGHAAEFGFVNYPFEPWHWEWTGEAP